MDGVDVALWIAAAALTGVSTWLTLPRPAALDWELFFKLALVTALRGDVEREGGDAERWVKLARSRIWYHPGGRDLERKVLEPAGYEPEIPARQGERGLLEALVRLPDPAARLALLLGEERGDEVLFDDPAALGGEYDLERALGPGASWNGLAARNPDLDGALRRRNAHNVWVVLGHPALAGALAEILGEGSVAALEVGDAEALAIALDERLSAPSIRLVLVAAGAAGGPLLEALHANPGLRDRVRAVVGVGLDLSGREGWLAENFTHEQLDTEISRAVPFLHLGFVVPGVLPPGEPGAPLSASRFPSVPAPPTGRVAIESIDLGVLPGPAADYPPALLARGLAVVITARLAIGG